MNSISCPYYRRKNSALICFLSAGVIYSHLEKVVKKNPTKLWVSRYTTSLALWLRDASSLVVSLQITNRWWVVITSSGLPVKLIGASLTCVLSDAAKVIFFCGRYHITSTDKLLQRTWHIQTQNNVWSHDFWSPGGCESNIRSSFSAIFWFPGTA